LAIEFREGENHRAGSKLLSLISIGKIFTTGNSH
jgi:hypothetical protein